jgi:hypothetical protein
MSFDAATASTGRILTEKETDAAALRQAKCAGWATLLKDALALSARPALQFTSGERYGDLVFERVVNAQARLYLFRHACGWRETFTDFQWRERKAT